MKTKLLLSVLFIFDFCLLSSQVPQGFNYQAIAREGGNPVTTPIGVMLTIQSTSVGGTTYWIEQHTGVQPNSQGLFTIVVGNGVKQAGSTANTFSDIDWSVSPKYLKTEINTGSGFVTMGTSQMLSVPYSLVAKNLVGPVGKFGVTGTTLNMEEALFEVKNNTGQTVFAVYNEGVRVYVDNGAKGVKGGFAIGGFGTEKAGTSQPLFIVNSDSIRAYINPNLLDKGIKGGFAIGGFDGMKAVREQYLLVNSHSAQINMRESLKGVKAGFAIGTYSPGKADPVPTTYTNLTKENYFIGHEAGKSITTGLYNSIIGYRSGFSLTEGLSNSFFGYQTGFNNLTGSYNVFLGNNSGYTNSSGSSNVFIGPWAGNLNTIGYANVFIGIEAGRYNTTGERGIKIGDRAGLFHKSGEGSVCIGYEAGSGYDGSANIYEVTGQKNTLIGLQTGKSNLTGSDNTIVGYQSGIHFRGGSRNTYMGSWIQRENIYSSQPDDNVYIGYGVAYSNQEGDKNVIIGSFAGGHTGFEGSGSVFIGYNSGSGETGSNKLYIDNSSSTSPLIYGDFTDGSEKLIFNGSVGIGTTPGAKLSIAGLTGSATGSNLIINGNNVYYLTSRRETKDEIAPLNDDFNKILQAIPVSFRDKNSGMYGIGYIAEDFESAGLQKLLVYEDNKLVSLRYDLISIYNLELIKQQKIKIETVERENSQLKTELEFIKSEIEQIKSLISKDGSVK